METTKHDVKTVFQREDGYWPIADKLLTDEEFEKLRLIMENTSWIIVKYPGMLYTTSEEIQRTLLKKLCDETLNDIKNAGKVGVPLPQSARDDIQNNTKP